MEVESFATVAGFAGVASPYLECHEAEHNLLLGLTARLAAGGPAGWVASDDPPSFWAVLDGGAPVGAALVTPPYDLVISRCRPGAPAALARHLHEHGVVIPGVTGSREAADEFVEAWRAATGADVSLWRRERIYELRAVRPPEGASGASRPARSDDLVLLTDWLAAFAAFTGEPIDAGGAGEAAADAIARGRALLWTDPEPVSIALWSRMTRTGASVGPVYTPPERRGRGYASAVTAALSQQLLSSGRAFCCLYTDLGNPTSNRIYQRIGYEPVVDVNHYRFGCGPDQEVEPGSAIA